MPPKQRAAAKKKRKGGKAKKKTNRVPDEREEQPSTGERDGAETRPAQPAQPAQDHDPDAEDKEESPALQIQRIVKFYEAHPYLYNLRHEKYSNSKLKEAKLAELAKEIKWTVEEIKRRFKNLRTAYGKLKKRAGSARKSGQLGQASWRLTSGQEWKLQNLAFLDEVIQPRTRGQELGRDAGQDEDEDEDDGKVDRAQKDLVAPGNEDKDRGTEGQKRGGIADSQVSASKRKRNRAGISNCTSISRKKKGENSVPDVGENQRRDRETKKKVVESATRQPDEREVLARWFQTVVYNCSKENFGQFQTEILDLSLRYQKRDEGHRMSGQECPASPPASTPASPPAPPPAPPPALLPAPTAMFPPLPAASQFPAQGQFRSISQQFQQQPQPQFQQKQLAGYMPIVTQFQNNSTQLNSTQLNSTQQQQLQQQPQQLPQQQHQATCPTYAPTSVSTYLDLLPGFSTPELLDGLNLSLFSAMGSFSSSGTSRDESADRTLMSAQDNGNLDITLTLPTSTLAERLRILISQFVLIVPGQPLRCDS